MQLKNDQSITVGVRFLGLDDFQKNLYVDNLERQANYLHFYRRSEEKLDKIKKLYTRTVNHLKDYLQKLSTKLGEESDLIVVEKIDFGVMGSALQFGKISTKTDLGCSGRVSLISSNGEFPSCSRQTDLCIISGMPLLREKESKGEEHGSEVLEVFCLWSFFC